MAKKRIPWEEYLDKISDMLDTLTEEQRDILTDHISVIKYKKNDIVVTIIALLFVFKFIFGAI